MAACRQETFDIKYAKYLVCLPKSNPRLVVSAISALVPQDVKSQSSAERMPIELNCRGRSLGGNSLST
jgi:hypothetical protein